MNLTASQVAARVARGVGVALWTPTHLAGVLTPRTRRILVATNVQIACLHGGPDRMHEATPRVAPALLALRPDLRLHVGVGLDVQLGDVVRRAKTLSAAVADVRAAVRRTLPFRPEVVWFDAEAPFKNEGAWQGTGSKAIGETFARACIDAAREEVAAAGAATLLGMTSYDRPTSHDMDWRVWYGDGGVDVAAPQLYVGTVPEGEDQATWQAGTGALAARVARHRASWRAAVRRGDIRADMAVWPYLHGHHVPATQTASAACDTHFAEDPHPNPATVGVGAEAHVALVWCAEAVRLDADGVVATAAAAAAYRDGRPPREIQRAGGETPDGLLGPRTRRLLGVDEVALRREFARAA